MNLDELEKGLVCLVPKDSAVSESSTLLSCHEYSVCDCTVLKLIADLRKAREVLVSICITYGHAGESIEKDYAHVYKIARQCLSELNYTKGGGA